MRWAPNVQLLLAKDCASKFRGFLMILSSGGRASLKEQIEFAFHSRRLLAFGSSCHTVCHWVIGDWTESSRILILAIIQGLPALSDVPESGKASRLVCKAHARRLTLGDDGLETDYRTPSSQMYPGSPTSHQARLIVCF
jgi:hypothetical protein